MSATLDFRDLAVRVVDDLLRADPVSATSLGDHRHDDRLPEQSRDAVAGRLRAIDEHLTALDAIDDVELDVTDLVDLEILRAGLLASRFELADLRSLTWDPLQWNPGTALHLLMSREFAPADERRASMRGRLAAIPDFLLDARGQLDEMPHVHVETALQQLEGTRDLLDGAVREFVDDHVLVERAVAEVDDFRDWLTDRLPDARRNPRLGEVLYAATLWHRLDDDVSPARLLADAEAHLELVADQLVEVAGEYLGRNTTSPGIVREALDDVASGSPVTDRTVLALMQSALDRTTDFVRQADLVTIPDLDVRLIEMPEIHRGVAVAYCDAPGPLESARVPTYVAVSPTPTGWSPERTASFYREYNGIQLDGLTIHEAMPGHVLQLAHAQLLRTPTPVRRAATSGVFVEGWAVYAEELMLARGYAPDGDPRRGLALRLQQLKMQARTTINAILDVRVHAEGMTEDEALALMRDRGFQEEGEAVGKWRRVLLTAGQLPTYFAGYRAVGAVAADLRVLHPDWSDREVHDLMLGHGSPAPRHLRTLLGI